jgi:hypothetical protein
MKKNKKITLVLSIVLSIILGQSGLLASQSHATGSACSSSVLSSNYKAPSSIKYIFVGLRGSGEAVSSGLGTGMGSRIEAIYNVLVANPNYKGIVCSAGPASYQASSVPDGTNSGAWNQYLGSISSVSATLKTNVATLMKNNPKVKVFIAGYSQGAAIAHLTVSSLSSTSGYSKRLSLIAIADPLASSNDPRVSGGDTGWTNPSDDGILTIAIKHPELARSQYAGAIQALGMDNGLGSWVSGVPVIIITVAMNKSLATAIADKDLINKGARVYPVCVAGDAVCAPAPAGFFNNVLLIPQKVNAGALNGTWFNVGIHTSAYSGANTLWASNILKDLITNKF